MKIYLMAALLTVIAICGKAQIKGVVMDPDKTPLIGATVYWEGTTKGTTTNTKGEFSIKHIKDAKTLIVSYMGYSDQKISITPKSKDLQIILQPNTEQISDVTIIKRDKGSQLSKLTTYKQQSFREPSYVRLPAATWQKALQQTLQLM